MAWEGGGRRGEGGGTTGRGRLAHAGWAARCKLLIRNLPVLQNTLLIGSAAIVAWLVSSCSAYR